MARVSRLLSLQQYHFQLANTSKQFVKNHREILRVDTEEEVLCRSFNIKSIWQPLNFFWLEPNEENEAPCSRVGVVSIKNEAPQKVEEDPSVETIEPIQFVHVGVGMGDEIAQFTEISPGNSIRFPTVSDSVYYVRSCFGTGRVELIAFPR